MQQYTVYTNEVDASLFTTDTTTPCDYNISVDMPNSNIQYHDFDNGDALTFTDKYTALLQQELQNPY